MLIPQNHSIQQLQSVFLQRTVDLEVFYPPQLSSEKINLLLLNDGQEASGLQIGQTLSSLYSTGEIEPLFVVAIKADINRIQEYGIAGFPDFKGRGALAGNYTAFIIHELIPFIEKLAERPVEGTHAIAGCSLGGLSAFDIAWNHDDKFDIAGVFSGSFWWRSKDLEDGYTDDDRIMHKVIRNTAHNPKVKFWLMTGTDDEQADRNGNGIIDAVDDTIDIIKELIKKGYKRPDDIIYYEMVGGRHHVHSWAKAMPAFLIQAFGSKSIFLKK